MSLVEYVLFIGCFALVAVTAVGGLNDVARQYFSDSSSRVGQPINRIKYDRNGNRQQLASTTSITAAPVTTTTAAPTTTRATTTTTTAPTTTVAPTTTRATTTTTRATTTTTSTTTTTVPRRVSTSLSNSSYNTSGGSWTFRVTVSVTGQGGASVNGLTVQADGKVFGSVAATLSCVTISSGVCTMQYAGVPDSYSPVVLEITSVSGTAPWTGATRSITVYSP